MKKDFDIKITNTNGETSINYGIFKGTNLIIFIKVGQDGSIYGYKNKYLKIAKAINKKYKYTIICSSNPSTKDNNPLQYDIEVIEKYCIKNNINDYSIYYFGHSKGALIGCQNGYKYNKIKRMLLINAPLMINWHKTKEGLLNFKQDKIIMVYGNLDPSYKYVELLNEIKNPKFKYYVIDGENHNFSNGVGNFNKLPEKYLLK